MTRGEHRRSPGRSHFVLGLGVTALCCGSPAEPATVAEPTPSVPDPAVAERGPDAPPINRVLARMAELRGLAVKGAVQGRVVSRREMMSVLETQLQEQVPAHVRLASGELLVALGLAPHDFDYDRSLRTLLYSALAGFYAPKTKTMYLARDLPATESHATLTHELVHALQDQHYDLGPHLRYVVDKGDEQTAFHALAEGDATSAMLDELLLGAGKQAYDVSDEKLAAQFEGSTHDPKDVPGILQRSIIAPYVDGLRFVHWARRRGGWPEVDRIWRTPPASTEQLLHPKKYLQREAPIPVSVPSSPPGGPTKVLFRDVMGEQSLRLVLEEWRPKADAALAASGWGGDRVAVFHDGGPRWAVAWVLQFDALEHAARSFAAWTHALKSQGPSGHSSEVCETRSAGPLVVRRSGKRVVVTVGPYHREAHKRRPLVDCAAARAWARDLTGSSP